MTTKPSKLGGKRTVQTRNRLVKNRKTPKKRLVKPLAKTETSGTKQVHGKVNLLRSHIRNFQRNMRKVNRTQWPDMIIFCAVLRLKKLLPKVAKKVMLPT